MILKLQDGVDDDDDSIVGFHGDLNLNGDITIVLSIETNLNNLFSVSLVL